MRELWAELMGARLAGVVGPAALVARLVWTYEPGRVGGRVSAIQRAWPAGCGDRPAPLLPPSPSRQVSVLKVVRPMGTLDSPRRAVALELADLGIPLVLAHRPVAVIGHTTRATSRRLSEPPAMGQPTVHEHLRSWP